MFAYDQCKYLMHSEVQKQLQKDFNYAKHSRRITLFAICVLVIIWGAFLVPYLQSEKQWLAHAFIGTFSSLVALIFMIGMSGIRGASRDLDRLCSNPAAYAIANHYRAFTVETASPTRLAHDALCEAGNGVDRAVAECREALQGLFDLRMNYVIASSDPKPALTNAYLDSYQEASRIIQRLIKLNARLRLIAVYGSTIMTQEEARKHKVYWTQRLWAESRILLEYTRIIGKLYDEHQDIVNMLMNCRPTPWLKERRQHETARVLALLRERE